MVTIKFSIINIHLDENGQLRKNQRRHYDKMNVDRNIKVPDLILSTVLFSKNDIG